MPLEDGCREAPDLAIEDRGVADLPSREAMVPDLFSRDAVQADLRLAACDWHGASLAFSQLPRACGQAKGGALSCGGPGNCVDAGVQPKCCVAGGILTMEADQSNDYSTCEAAFDRDLGRFDRGEKAASGTGILAVELCFSDGLTQSLSLYYQPASAPDMIDPGRMRKLISLVGDGRAAPSCALVGAAGCHVCYFFPGDAVAPEWPGGQVKADYTKAHLRFTSEWGNGKGKGRATVRVLSVHYYEQPCPCAAGCPPGSSCAVGWRKDAPQQQYGLCRESCAGGCLARLGDMGLCAGRWDCAGGQRVCLVENLQACK